MAKVTLDTGVIIEFIDLKGKFHEQAAALLDSITKGQLEAILPHPVLTETFYVAAKIYAATGADNPLEKAAKLVTWFYHLPAATVCGEQVELALEAGRVKHCYRLALTDCYVLAASRIYHARPIFRKREHEMIKMMEKIEEEYKPIFLEDYT